MATEDALLAHIVSRMQADIDFLVSQNVISPADGQEMAQRLPGHQAPVPVPRATPTPVNALARAPVLPAARRSVPQPAVRSAPQARALWAYNVDGQEAEDLSFDVGETIEILEETNRDWWKGKNQRGKTGLFPSNYVEKIPAVPATSPYAGASSAVPAYSASSGGRMVAPLPTDRGSYDPMAAPPPAPPVQQSQEQKPRNKYGQIMAQSAAGGVGFGAGAAIGSGIVNAIF